ncbi:hypothetical protein, partial [Salmonella enterica]|uniref:hypothetical protein n=1 Tax=Salmonella enterica TaxID=28901 RepID=UPI001E2C80AE
TTYSDNLDKNTGLPARRRELSLFLKATDSRGVEARLTPFPSFCTYPSYSYSFLAFLAFLGFLACHATLRLQWERIQFETTKLTF